MSSQQYDHWGKLNLQCRRCMFIGSSTSIAIPQYETNLLKKCFTVDVFLGEGRLSVDHILQNTMR